MYEFTSKEERKEFKKTNYGKKTNTYILISYICFFISLVISVILTITSNNTLEMSSELNRIIVEELNMSFLSYISYVVTLLCGLFLIYFDGKRDGAIKAYKESKK